MNTCQTSIKTSVLLMYLGNLHPRYERHETPHWFHYRTEQKGESQAGNHWPPKYISYNETTETIIAFYWSEKSTNLSAFWNIILSAFPITKFGRFGNRHS